MLRAGSSDKSVMKQTTTYYDLLGVSPYADLREISAAYLELSRAVPAAGEPPDEATELRRQLLKQAFDVLTNPSRRADYDAGLALRAGGLPGGDLPLPELALETTRWSPIRRLLTVIAALMVVGLTIQVSVMFVAYQRARATLGEEAAAPAAAEKAYLQDIYQTYGIRAASREEAELLLADLRRKEEAAREEKRAQQQQEDEERKEKRFAEDARIIGAEVTANVQRAEQEMQRAQQEEARRKEEKEQAEKAAERARLEREVNRWRGRSPVADGE